MTLLDKCVATSFLVGILVLLAMCSTSAHALTDEERATYEGWYARLCAGPDGEFFTEDDRTDGVLTCQAWRLILTAPDPDDIVEVLELSWVDYAVLDPIAWDEFLNGTDEAPGWPFYQHILYNTETGIAQHCYETPFGVGYIQAVGLGSPGTRDNLIEINTAIPEGFQGAADYCQAWADHKLLGTEMPPTVPVILP